MVRLTVNFSSCPRIFYDSAINQHEDLTFGRVVREKIPRLESGTLFVGPAQKKRLKDRPDNWVLVFWIPLVRLVPTFWILLSQLSGTSLESNGKERTFLTGTGKKKETISACEKTSFFQGEPLHGIDERKKRVIDPRFSSNNRVTPSLSFFYRECEGVALKKDKSRRKRKKMKV